MGVLQGWRELQYAEAAPEKPSPPHRGIYSAKLPRRARTSGVKRQ